MTDRLPAMNPPKLYNELAEWWPLMSAPEEYVEKPACIATCSLRPARHCSVPFSNSAVAAARTRDGLPQCHHEPQRPPRLRQSTLVEDGGIADVVERQHRAQHLERTRRH
jgi:hypothetical protein